MKVSYVDFPAQFAQSREETLQAIEAVFEQGDFILGKSVKNFEDSFAKISGARYAVSVANGTDSLILAYRLLGIGPGDEVITAPNSWISSASSIALVGARPVFADVLDDQCIDPAAIRKVITKNTKAIVPVHLTGRCANFTELKKIAIEFNLPIIEDAAQSVTAVRDGMVAGSVGRMASFSLHPLKNLNAAGDAGILTTNDEKVASQLRLLRNHGLKNRDEIECWGYNSRLDTLQAAVLNLRLNSLEQTIDRRRNNAKKYFERLACILNEQSVTNLSEFNDDSELFHFPERSNERHTYHVFVIQCRDRDQLQQKLLDAEIETKIHYPIPIHLQKAAADLKYKNGDFKKTEDQAKRILSLPIHQFLTDLQIDYVCEKILNFYGKKL